MRKFLITVNTLLEYAQIKLIHLSVINFSREDMNKLSTDTRTDILKEIGDSKTYVRKMTRPKAKVFFDLALETVVWKQTDIIYVIYYDNLTFVPSKWSFTYKVIFYF